MKITALIVAGGSGSRMGAGMNKIFLKLCGKCVIEHTVDVFVKNNQVDAVVIVTRNCDIPFCRSLFEGCEKVKQITEGGLTRQESVYNGIRACDADMILIHDAARALIDAASINSVIADCMQYRYAAVGVKCKDTLKTADCNGFIIDTVDREHTYQIQTPQAFFKKDILSAHERAKKEGIRVTDDCALIERYGGAVKITNGSYENIKLTTPEDMLIGEKIMQKRHIS